LKPKEAWVEEAKKKAASEAVKHVKNEDIVGLGTGSTAAYAIEALGERVRREKLRILGVATSYQAFELANRYKIPITTLEEHPTIDITIDGADQVNAKLDLIKGMGGALTREKIVASASKRNIIVADISKKVKVLGENNHPVPVEVLPFAAWTLGRKIENMGGKPILREGKGKVGSVITENGNLIIDATFGLIDKPADLEQKLRLIPGVVETGLFVGSTDVAYLGTSSTVKKIERKRK
jgi:ribose 5-phosphate isomerase A